MGDDFYHEPVLINEAIGLLTANKSAATAKVYVDCTLGGGGYTSRILEETEEDFIVIAVDRDSNAIDYSKNLLQKYKSRLLFVKDNFADISGIVKSSLKNENAKVSGIVVDLGLSSYQLNFEEGFSYQKDTELDMRADKDTEFTAKDILNDYT